MSPVPDKAVVSGMLRLKQTLEEEHFVEIAAAVLDTDVLMLVWCNLKVVLCRSYREETVKELLKEYC